MNALTGLYSQMQCDLEHSYRDFSSYKFQVTSFKERVIVKCLKLEVSSNKLQVTSLWIHVSQYIIYKIYDMLYITCAI